MLTKIQFEIHAANYRISSKFTVFTGKIVYENGRRDSRRRRKKIVQYKRKLSTDYQNATHMVAPFENMMNFMNYNASKYISEGNKLRRNKRS